MKTLAALIVGLAIGYSAQALAAPKAQPTHGSMARQLVSMNRQLKALGAGQRAMQAEQEAIHGELRTAQGKLTSIDTRTALIQDVLTRLCAAHAVGIDCRLNG
jgi:hypothetical protein